MTTPDKPRIGRPPGTTRTDRTATLPPVRVTPAEREKFNALGGADWLRRQIAKGRVAAPATKE